MINLLFSKETAKNSGQNMCGDNRLMKIDIGRR